MKNKDIIVQYLKDKSIDSNNPVTTLDVADYLNIQRSNASALLNRLVEEGKIVKCKTWPVSYCLSNGKNDNERVLHEIVGYDGSMKNVVKQIRAAVLYPNKCLNTMILGSPGSGKSTIAKRMFDYAVSKGKISEDKEMVSFNCLDYKNNRDKLREDFINTLYSAEDTFFFIDNVDYLDLEPRSILTHLMNNGYIHLDGNKKNINTTIIVSLQNEKLINEFAGFTPIVISIPDLKDWNIRDRFVLIQQLFNSESVKSGRKIEVSYILLIALLLYEFPYNIKQLENEIIKSCANAYVRCYENNKEPIQLLMSDFSNEIKNGLLQYKNYRNEIEEAIQINKDYIFYNNDYSVVENADKNNIYYFINQRSKELRKEGISDENISRIINMDINNEFEKLRDSLVPVDFNIDKLYMLVDKKVIELAKEYLEEAKKELKREYPGNVLYGLCMHLNALITKRDQQTLDNNQIIEFIENNMSEYKLASEFAKKINVEYAIQMSISEVVLLGMFISKYDNYEENDNHPYILLCMHGNSLAYYAVEICHSFGSNNIVGFDLPLDISPMDAYDSLKQTVMKIPNRAGIIAIADSGSIKDLLNMVSIELGIEIRVLEVPFMVFLLECCRKAKMVDNIEEAFNNILESYSTISHVSNDTEKKEAIITVCMTGQGGALEAKSYLEKKYELNDIEILPIQLKEKNKLIEKLNRIEKEYKIICIIGTYNPQIASIPFVPIDKIYNDIDSLKRIIKVNKVLYNYGNEEIDEIFMSLKNNLENTSIVEEKKIYYDFVDEISKISEGQFTETDRIGMIIHIVLMLDRIISNKKINENVFKKQLFSSYPKDYVFVKNCMKPFEKNFNIIVSDEEIAYVLQIIKKFRV